MNYYEIEACVIRAKNGNKEELLKVMEQFKPFIFKTARGFNIKNYDLYDLMQNGYVSLINAVANYKVGSNTFSSYALNAITNGLRYIARQNNRYDGEVSLNKPSNNDIDPNGEFMDCIEASVNIEEDIIEAEKVKELRRVVAKLPSDEMELIIMVYYSGASIKTYAEKKGISYQQAIRRKKRALDKLHKYIKKED